MKLKGIVEMAVNLANLFEVIDQQKQISKGRGSSYEWLYRSQLQPGDYRVRFVSNEMYCPSGVHVYTIHEIPRILVQDKWKLKKEERDEAFYRVLCTESYKGRHAETGKLLQPCPVCDFVNDFRNTMEEEEKLDTIDEDIARAIDNMSANECRKMLYPMLIYAAQTEVVVNNTTKKVWIPSDRECALVLLSLSVQNYESNADLSLAKKIAAVALEDPANASILGGRWFTFQKKTNSQNLVPAERGELTAKERDLLKKYPKVNEFGQSEEGKFAKNYKCGYEKGLQYLKQSWVYPIISQQGGEYEYTVDGLQRGQV